MKNKEKLLDILKMLAGKDSDIECMFGGDGYMDKEITLLSEIIMEEYGIEKENEIVFEQLMNFCDSDITKEKLLSKYLKV
jgi:hypothetical protein